MTKQELQKIYNYENSDLENRNMGEIRKLIYQMSCEQKNIIAADLVLSHNEEADYDELYELKEKAESEIDEINDNLQKEMMGKDKAALKEYLDLIQKDAKEQFAANKTPMYVSPEEMTVELFDAIQNKRALKAEVDCTNKAQQTFHVMTRQEDIINK